MWLWDYIMLVRQRQAVRRNVRVPVVYIGIGESPHEYSHMCVCVRVLVPSSIRFLSFATFGTKTTTGTRVQYHTQRKRYTN